MPQHSLTNPFAGSILCGWAQGQSFDHERERRMRRRSGAILAHGLRAGRLCQLAGYSDSSTPIGYTPS
jgi:hypothetical protein